MLERERGRGRGRGRGKGRGRGRGRERERQGLEHVHVYTCTCSLHTLSLPLSSSLYTHTYLEQRPVALLVQEGCDHRDASDLPHCVLGHLGTGVSAGDVPQSTHGRFNDVLATPSIVDGLQQTLWEAFPKRNVLKKKLLSTQWGHIQKSTLYFGCVKRSTFPTLFLIFLGFITCTCFALMFV